MIKDYKDSSIGKIPKNWNIEKLGKVAKTFAGGTPKRGVAGYYGGSIPWIKSGEVNNNSIECSEEYVTELALKESSAKLIEANSILVAMYGATAGKVGVLKVEACSNQAVLAVTSKNDALSNDFLYHYLKKCTNELLNLCQGSGQPNLSKGIVDSVQIPIPSIPEQQKIAEILSTVDNKIEVIDQQIIETQELKKGLMQRLLTKGIGHTEFKNSPLGMIPESWEVLNVGDFANVTAGGTPSTQEPTYWGGNIPWMNSGEINLRRIKSVEGRITDVGLKNSSTKIIAVNSVLMALAGQGKTRGKVAINEIPLCTNQSLATIYNFKNASYEYVFQNLESRYSEIRKMSTGDGGRGGLNLAIIKAIKLALPPLKEQEKIADLLKLFDDKLTILEEKKSHYQELKQGLMQQLLKGKIRVKV